MAFWNEPIEIRRLWRGPRLLTPMASCACTWIGRFAVILGVGVLVLFVVAMLTFVIAVVVIDPAIGPQAPLLSERGVSIGRSPRAGRCGVGLVYS